MSKSLDYREVTCARCGLANRRFSNPLLNPRHAHSCDHCGANLASGKRNIVDLVHQILIYSAVYFFCALIGLFIAMTVFMLGGFLLLGKYYDTVRPLLLVLMWVVGIGGGIAVAERSRRKNIAAAQAAARPMDAVARTAVDTKAKRQLALTIGFVLAFAQGAVVIGLFKAIGIPEMAPPVYGILWVGFLAGGWIWGRVKYPTP